MNKLDKDYQALLQDILDNGVTKKDRTGTGTISVFGRQIRHKMSDGFPLLTTKKMYFKGIVTELLWFLRGDTNIKYLVDNGCHIWDGDAYKNYVSNHEKDEWTDAFCKQNLKDCGDQWDAFDKEEFINKIKTDDEFAKKWGELGLIYGKQWRSWEVVTLDKEYVTRRRYIDQIANLINDLKINPDSRRLMVSAWNVGELDQMVLPPCHYGFQVYTRELTASERITYKTTKQTNFLNSNDLFDFIKSNVSIDLDSEVNKKCDESNIPTRAISLMFNMRSTDVGLGLSFNLASYGLLLMMIAKQGNMVPDELIYNGGDVHLYLNHIEPIKEQLTREPYKLPIVKILDRIVDDIAHYELSDFELIGYQSHPTIKLPLSN
jgi:thymidylate synthase